MAKAKRYDPASNEPFPLSRSKIDLFLDCPRCFYLDRRLGIKRPSGPPFTLNVAVDALLKSEFDLYRARSEPHPYMVKAGINAVPHAHPELDNWRNNFKGVRVHHTPTNFIVFGAIDDLWRDLATEELIVVDYKATSKAGEVNLDAEWQISYKRQMEVYQWLLRGHGLPISSRGWFLYCNGLKAASRFDSRLEFKSSLLFYDGSSAWIESCLDQVLATLRAPSPPSVTEGCEYCEFATTASAC